MGGGGRALKGGGGKMGEATGGRVEAALSLLWKGEDVYTVIH